MTVLVYMILTGMIGGIIGYMICNEDCINLNKRLKSEQFLYSSLTDIYNDTHHKNQELQNQVNTLNDKIINLEDEVERMYVLNKEILDNSENTLKNTLNVVENHKQEITQINKKLLLRYNEGVKDTVHEVLTALSGCDNDVLKQTIREYIEEEEEYDI